MKKLAGLVIILAVLVLGGYYVMGLQTEKTIKQNIEVIEENNAGLKVEINEYNRGWFCSNAKVTWQFHVPEHVIKDAAGNSHVEPAQDLKVEMPVKIHHGPIIFANNAPLFGMGYATSKLPLPKDYSQKFDALFTKESIKPVLDLSIFVNFLNKSVLELNIPAFKLTSKEPKSSQINWTGLESKTTLTSNLDKVNGSLIIKASNAVTPGVKFGVGDIDLDYNFTKNTQGLYLGDAKFSMVSLDIEVPNQEKFQLSDLEFSSNTSVDQNLYSSHLNMNLKSIVGHGKTYGPGSVEMSLRNLDAEVLGQINQQIVDMKAGTDAERQQNMLALLPLLPKLLNKGAEFEISKFDMKLPQGQMKGNLLISLPKGDSANPFELLQKVQGHAKLNVPASIVKLIMHQSVKQQIMAQPEMKVSLVQQFQGATPATLNQPEPSIEQLAAMQADKQIAGLVQAGLIVAEGEDYSIELNLEQGKLSVNGKPYDPASLKF